MNLRRSRYAFVALLVLVAYAIHGYARRATRPGSSTASAVASASVAPLNAALGDCETFRDRAALCLGRVADEERSARSEWVDAQWEHFERVRAALTSDEARLSLAVACKTSTAELLRACPGLGAGQ